MKKILTALCVVFSVLSSAQKFVLKEVESGKEFPRGDSLQVVRFLDSLAQTRFFLTKVRKVEERNSKIYIFYEKGPDFNRAKVFPSNEIQREMNLAAEIATENLDSLRLEVSKFYAAAGYPFNRVKTNFNGIKNGLAEVKIEVEKGKNRTIDAIVVRGYEKIAPQFLKNLQKSYKGKPADKKTLLKLKSALANEPNFALDRNPEVLYTKDSTEVYLFLNKKSNNSFDGIVGFGNDEEGNFSFNGNLHVALQNVFNRFEKMAVSWQRTPQRAQQFQLQTDFPYLFNTNIGTNFQLNILRQDSAFATASVKPVLYYNLGTRHKLGLSANYETSAGTAGSAAVADFTKNGAGFWYRYFDPGEFEIFDHRSQIDTEIEFANASYGDGTKHPQQKFSAKAGHHFHISGNHFMYLSAEGAAVRTDRTLFSNELLRLGGWNSLRGFGEESLLAKSYFFGGPEYRYLLNEGAFFDAFVQAGRVKNLENTGVYSAGVGFNIVVSIGLMSFQISNGNTFDAPFSFAQTKIHWGVITRF